MHYFLDLYSKDYDNLYREPRDGMISLNKNFENNPIKPEIELITLIDLSTLYEEKQRLAGRIAEQLCTLNHVNLLNITRELKYLDNSMTGGFL